jgi:biopolymer transport protein ExbD
MTQVNSNGEVPGRKRAGVARMLRHNLKVDMTPMVDLGFLLITFFIITTEMTKPTMAPLYMPKDAQPPNDVGESSVLTILLDGKNTWYYNGDWKNALLKGRIRRTQLGGDADIRNAINEKQRFLDSAQLTKEGRDGLMMLIKPGVNASYKTIVDMLDEAAISRVKKYAIVKLTSEEVNWMGNQ